MDVIKYLVTEGAALDKVRRPLIQYTTNHALIHTPRGCIQADSFGRTALHAAASHGRLAEVCFLLARGADKDKADKSGQTPLHAAARWGHLAVVFALLEGGANKMAYDENGETFVDIADPKVPTSDEKHNRPFRHPTRSSLRLLTTYFPTTQVRPYVRLASLPPGDPTALAQALANGAAVWFEMARTAFPEPQIHALARQFPQLLRATDKTGQSCLHVAAGRGHATLVTFFVQNGADKDAADQYGRTPLHAATESGHQAVVKYLLQQGAGRRPVGRAWYTCFYVT